MENQDKLDKEIGEKEIQKLKPAKVKIEQVEIKTVGEGKKAADKVVAHCKHPDQEELIRISSVSYKKGKEIRTTGLWYKEDEEEKLRKGSALTLFLELTEAKTIRELIGKEVITEEDDRGYLCFKAY